MFPIFMRIFELNSFHIIVNICLYQSQLQLPCELIVFKPSTEIKKQNAEKISEMSDIVAKSKCDFADEIEKERASSKQLRDALNNLQVIFA